MAERTDVVETGTLIVGAGAAGLAVAACLKQRNQPFILIEQSDHVADSWRRHYDRLHLHTSRGLSGLPGYPMPRHYPKYPSRDQVVAYVEQYAAYFELEPVYYQRLVHAERVDGRWRSTTEDRRYVSDNLVIATGYARRPNVPQWPGRAKFAGPIIHSSQYRNGQPFVDQDVLVVGFGNSGGEIAVDLFEHGARPAIVVRSPVNIVARDTLGISSVSWNLVLSRLPGNLGDWVAAPLVRASVGDLTRYGVRKSRIGPIEQIKALEQIPLIDVGTVKLIKQGHLSVYPAIERFTRTSVIFIDGREVAFDAVVLATGYRPDLHEFIPDAAEAMDQGGSPAAGGRALPRPGLYVCGFNVSRTGMLREIGIEARRIAALISLHGGD